MKKLISLLLALIMVLGMAACGAAPTPTTAPSEPAPAPTAVPTEPVPAPTAAPTPTDPVLSVDTCILMETDNDMLNTYSIIAVNPDAPFVDADGKEAKKDGIALNTAGADALIQWLLSEEALKLAGEFGMGDEYLFYILDGAPKYEGEIPAATEETKVIRLSTTTSVNDSGLLGYLLPVFKEKYGYEVEVFSKGTGISINNAKMGNADLILVHSKKQEEAFIEAGFGRVVEGFEAERISFLYNFYVLCGPSTDPAGVKSAASVKDAFKAIADGKYTFISRGDNSGTHTKELALWPADLGITAEAASFAAYTEWYNSAGAGMGICLSMAEQMGAYILTDKATFLTFQANGGDMG
ncbi:MAG: substrate-binding domain-containing protein [Oscillospiraceae bacterium]|nr:substrate-binding domain-containing protein [Oscillospiraceae bacterium]